METNRLGRNMWLAAGAAALASALILVGAGQPDAPENPDSVGAHMDAAGKAFRKLQKQIADPAQNAASLEYVQTIEENIVAAKKFVPDEWPDDWKTKTDSERAELVKGFRKDLATEVGLLLDVEKALVDDDNKAAADGLEKVKAGQKAGHRKYKKEDEHGPGGPGGPRGPSGPRGPGGPGRPAGR